MTGRLYSYVSPTERTMSLPILRPPVVERPTARRTLLAVLAFGLWLLGAAAALATAWAVAAHAPSLLLIGGAR